MFTIANIAVYSDTVNPKLNVALEHFILQIKKIIFENYIRKKYGTLTDTNHEDNPDNIHS